MTHADRIIALAERVDYLERLLSRAYPWLHNPYHHTSDTANWAEGDAVIEAVMYAIQHVPDEPAPPLTLPCRSCDGTGQMEAAGDELVACPNCTPQLEHPGD